MAQTMDQQRAACAWEQVRDIPPGDQLEKYKTLVEGAPATIQMAGLGQTIAFYLSKEEQHRQLVDHLAEWLLRERPQPEQTSHNLLEAILYGRRDEYARLTEDTLAYLVWLKRLTVARTKVPSLVTP